MREVIVTVNNGGKTGNEWEGGRRVDEIAQAKAEIEQARQIFNEATGRFIEVAALRLKAAELKLDILISESKKRKPAQ